ncbi:hypothetical protein HDU93_003804, partial [Gonapodya sp. JEL0774]
PNLRHYHQHWLTLPPTSTRANRDFWFWLDEGEGKTVSLAECPRAQLETKTVKYLQEDDRAEFE